MSVRCSTPNHPGPNDDTRSTMSTMNRVLVTGLPRSGTTFLGRVLSMPLSVAYVHEPLNVQCGLPGATESFVSLNEPEHAALADEMAAMLELRGTLRGSVFPDDSFLRRAAKRAVGGRGPVYLRLARLPPRPQHLVIKDPFAIYSIDWFSERGCQTITMIRHPAALVGSFRRLGWSFGRQIDELRDDPRLLDDHECNWIDRVDTDLDRIALFWRITHRLVVPQVGDGIIAIHEQLSRDPIRAVAELRAATGLPSSSRSDRRLRALTTGNTGAADPAGRTQQFRRASADILSGTLATLTDDEVARVWEIAGDVASQWYGPAEVR